MSQSPFSLRFLPAAAMLAVLAACSGASDDLIVGSVNPTAAGGAGGIGGAGGRGGNAASTGITLGGNAGDAANSGGACNAIEQETKNQLGPAEVIIVVDQSSSMAQETEFVREQLNAFAESINQRGIDVRVAVIAERPDGKAIDEVVKQIPSCVPEESFVENPICIPEPLAGADCGDNGVKFKSVSCHVDSTDALESVIDTYPLWKDILREGSTKHVVVVTDDKSDMSAATFTQEFTALDPRLEKFFFHGILRLGSCSGGNPAVYRTLVGQTGGVEGDLCTQDFEPVWTRIVESIGETAELLCEWQIPPAPAGTDFDPSLVNLHFRSPTQDQDLRKVATAADCDASIVDGWYYDDPAVPTRVLVCPTVCNAIRSSTEQRMDLEFGCTTRVLIK